MRTSNLDISFDEITQPATAGPRADAAASLWRSVRILFCMLGLLALAILQVRSTVPTNFISMAVVGLLCALVLRLVGIDRGHLRKRHIHALLEVEHKLALAGMAPWDMDGFKRRVEQFRAAHRRILLTESLYLPFLMLSCGILYLAGSLLGLNYDATVLPLISIVAIGTALMVGVLIRESKRLRILAKQVLADPAQIAV
jgi:hypothetical protein